MEHDETSLARALRRARRRLDAVGTEIGKIHPSQLSTDEWLLARAQVGKLVADFNDSVAEVDRILDTTGAQTRILRYLQLRQGEKVSKDELSGVAGIYEWARRIRELRQDHGWAIHSSVTRDDLRVGEYRLESDMPNEDLARDWEIARRTRKLRTSGGVLPPRSRVFEFLKTIYPRSADKEQLAHVAGSARAAEAAIAELRLEGCPIVDCDEDATQTPGEYRLASLKP